MEIVADVYRAAGYNQRTVGFGDRPALIVVDLQNAFIDPQFSLGRSPLIASAAAYTAQLLDEARDRGLPIFYTVISIRPDESDRGHWKIDLSACHADRWGTQVADVVRPAPEDLIIQKKMPSAFFGTDLLTQLVARGVDTAIVCGCVTSGCVRATIVDAFSYGFRTVVPEECCGDQTIQQHQANLLDVASRYADVLPLSAVLQHLRQLPAVPKAPGADGV